MLRSFCGVAQYYLSDEHVPSLGRAITGPIPGTVRVTVPNDPNVMADFSAIKHLTVSTAISAEAGRIDTFISDLPTSVKLIDNENIIGEIYATVVLQLNWNGFYDAGTGAT